MKPSLSETAERKRSLPMQGKVSLTTRQCWAELFRGTRLRKDALLRRDRRESRTFEKNARLCLYSARQALYGKTAKETE
ncbi:hypothetical protein NDU88_005248 [Pleurodeles waltl]|uniref:Uncharacterized protein n=1 Tax=Pleurodeles waltl TaxID=8319 RepID=A0AAV7M8R7_PLEWA|nr:hypothetical protein NDU88_005248 [Pleurodeles waltl]